MDSRNHCLLLLYIATIIINVSRVSCKAYFTAAVFEHARQGDKFPETVVKTNLQYYKRAAQVAKQQGADLIVFPEYGIFPPGERKEVKKYLEHIPNPKEVLVNPCDETVLYSERPILHSLSCMAKNNKVVVVANMGEIESCETESGCPEDGKRHLNTNVVFDRNGALLAKYSKERLFFEVGMDLPRTKQNPLFETDFGNFAMFISFDIIFQKMAQVSRFIDVDAILFPNMWVNISPFLSSTQFFQAWAIGNNANLLAANVQIPGYFAVGSGIFQGRNGAIGSTFNPDGIPKLIVATVPKQNRKINLISNITTITENGITQWKDDGKDLPTVCSYHVLGETKKIHEEYRCVNEKTVNYTLVKLNNHEDHVEVCNNGMCCELDYVANNMNETFYLGVFNGTHNSFNRYFWATENCFLARCDDFNGSACSHFPMHSGVVFNKISMKANFTTTYIYPSVMTSGMRLLPVKQWNYMKKYYNKVIIEFNNKSGIQLLLASLHGRPYDRDPPYIR